MRTSVTFLGLFSWVILNCTLCNSLKQCATCLDSEHATYFRSDCCFSHSMKQKNPVFPFSRRIRPFWQKILVLPVSFNVIRHTHAKFAPLDFIDEKIIGKRYKLNIPFLILWLIVFKLYSLHFQIILLVLCISKFLFHENATSVSILFRLLFKFRTLCSYAVLFSVYLWLKLFLPCLEFYTDFVPKIFGIRIILHSPSRCQKLGQ